MKPDQIYSLAQLERFDAAAYLAELALPVDVAGEHAAIDAMIARVMKLRLDFVDAVPPPTRKVFAATLVQYATQLDVLEQRVYSVAPAAVPAVIAAAKELLDLRGRLHAGVLALVPAPEPPAEPEPEPTFESMIELD